MPSFTESLPQENWTWPGLAAVWDAAQRGAREALPNPMRPLKNARGEEAEWYNPIPGIQRMAETGLGVLGAIPAAAQGALKAVNPALAQETERMAMATAPAMPAIHRAMPRMQEIMRGGKLATEGNPGGWVRTGIKDKMAVEAALDAMDERMPGVKHHILTSNMEFGQRPIITKQEVDMTFEPERAKHVAGWNEEVRDPNTDAVLGGRWNSVEGRYENQRQNLAEHEMGHTLLPSLGMKKSDPVPGMRLMPEGEEFLHRNLYPPDKYTTEAPSMFLSGDTTGDLVNIDDPYRFNAWLQKSFAQNPERINKPLWVIDPSVDLGTGPKMTREDYDKFLAGGLRKSDLVKNEVSVDNKIRHRQGQLIAAHQRKNAPQVHRVLSPVPAGPQPHAELADLLDSLGGSATPARIKTDLSGLSEADRPWNIPSAEQAGLYDALRPNTKKYGGSYAPGQAPALELDAQGRTLRQVEPMAFDPKLQEAAFDHAMARFTPLHTDTPTVKEMKRGRLQNFMDWWQRASDIEKSDYVKMLRGPAPETPPVRPPATTLPPQRLSGGSQGTEDFNVRNMPAWMAKTPGGRTAIRGMQSSALRKQRKP